MANSYLTFKRFSDFNLASDFAEFLKSKEINYTIEDNSPQFDVIFPSNSIEKEFLIKIRPADFERVEQLLIQKESDTSISDIPKDYYLLEFSNDELIEILMKPDEWSSLDYNLAQKTLKTRGKSIDPDFLKSLRKERNKALSQPEKSPRSWIYAGYLFAVLGGLLGVFIGWHLLTFKKTLHDGTRVYGYIAPDRKNGKYILIIALIFLLLEIPLWIKLQVSLM